MYTSSIKVCSQSVRGAVLGAGYYLWFVFKDNSFEKWSQISAGESGAAVKFSEE